MKHVNALVLPLLVFLGTALAPTLSLAQSAGTLEVTPAAPARTFDEAIDRAIAREKVLANILRNKAPVVETYIQVVKPDQDMGYVPIRDEYMVGKIDLRRGIAEDSFTPVPTGYRSVPYHVKKAFSFRQQYFPRGFDSMMFMDRTEFDKQHYKFSYVRREFLGDVRCLVVDVVPATTKGHDRFMGRIWVEDQDYNVVRFNGVFTPRGDRHSHFDSWRINAGPALWLPAYIYTQEVSHGIGILKDPPFRAQTRIWDYEPQADKSEEAFTNLTVNVEGGAKDESEAASNDNSPVDQQRLFQKQAENNILERLEKAGLVAPEGEVDQVLDTVVNNLIVTNNIQLDSPVRVRTMLTTPLESVPIGHTILISRGLVDVLPDEACLAAVLAHELAHIALNHTIDSRYAFADRLMYDDPEVIKHLNVARTEEEEDAADKKAEAYLQNSPYKDKLPKVGLFLRQLSARSEEVPHLIKPMLGNKLASTGKNLRLNGLMNMSPELQLRNPEQVAALPLGSRVRMNPWNNQLYMMKSHNVALMSAKEKLPFEITPFMLHLTREPNMPPAPNGSNPTADQQQAPANGQPLSTSQNTQAPKQQPF